jgi:hypothetical protein
VCGSGGSRQLTVRLGPRNGVLPLHSIHEDALMLAHFFAGCLVAFAGTPDAATPDATAITDVRFSVEKVETIAPSKKGVFSARPTNTDHIWAGDSKAWDVVVPSDHNESNMSMWWLLLPAAAGAWILWRTRRQRAPATVDKA